MRMFKRRRVLSQDETDANAKRRADRAKIAMHCQCCGRAILANTGLIAHHGFERPGHGWQTSSCFGARAVPFEAGRGRLGDMIVFLKERNVQLKLHLKKVNEEATTVPFSYVTYDNRSFGGTEHTIDVRRETFEEHFNGPLKNHFFKKSIHNFDARSFPQHRNDFQSAKDRVRN